MVNFENKVKYNVYDLKELIRILRAPGGCPWDAEQTHESIRRNFIEETYEVVEAINENNPEHMCEELGDVLTQVVFHSDIEENAGHFDLDDVADMVVRKLIYRHPHVFGNTSVSGTEDILTNWDALKRVEKNQDTVTDSLESVAKSLPGLWRAEKIQKKAAKAGFDWPDLTGAMDKLEEEFNELKCSVSNGHGIKEELGDLLFSVVNVSRFLNADPEDALSAACEKFISRFHLVEKSVISDGKDLATMSVDEMNVYWDAAKKALA